MSNVLNISHIEAIFLSYTKTETICLPYSVVSTIGEIKADVIEDYPDSRMVYGIDIIPKGANSISEKVREGWVTYHVLCSEIIKRKT